MNFDNRYKVYIDTTVNDDWWWNEDNLASWVEVSANLSEFTKQRYEDEYFHRYKWGEVTLRNLPHTPEMLFDTIFELYPSQQVRIKVVYDDITIRGYFGVNDCDIDFDKKIIKVTPAVLDKYTEVLENRKTEVDASGGINNYYANWKLDTQATEHDSTDHALPIILDNSTLTEAVTPQFSIAPQWNYSCIKSTKAKYIIDFTIDIDVLIEASAFKLYAQTFDNVGNLISSDLITSHNSLAGLPTRIVGTYIKEIILEKNNSLRLWVDMSDSFAFVTYSNVLVNAKATSVTSNALTLDLTTLGSELTQLEVWTENDLGTARPKYTDFRDDINGIEDYFDDDGSPILDGLFADNSFGMKTETNYGYLNNNKDLYEIINGLKLNAIANAMESYYYEISSVTVYRGEYYRSGLKRKRRVHATCTFSRDEYLLDTGEEPSGDGWHDVYTSGGKTLWARKPFNGTIDDWDLGTKDTTGGTFPNGWKWQEKLTSIKAYPNGETSKTINSARPFRDLITDVFRGSSDLLNSKDVVSTFFWNDNEGDLGYYTTENSGSNYVTGESPNVLNDIASIHTTNLNAELSKTDTDENEINITFEDLMADIKRLWPVFWFMEDDGTLHIEHVRYLDLKYPAVDISDKKTIDETYNFSYDKTNMFSLIKYGSVNSSYIDFTENKIEFDKIVSNKRNEDISNEITTEILTTDVRHCLENFSDLENGILLVAYSDGRMRLANVPIANKVFENGDLAYSNLLRKYWTYEGVWTNGKINGVNYNFKRPIFAKKGGSVSLSGVYSLYGNGDDIMFFSTKIGTGLLESMSIDLDKETTNDISIMYSYGAGASLGGFALIVSEDVYFDFGNYEM